MDIMISFPLIMIWGGEQPRFKDEETQSDQLVNLSLFHTPNLPNLSFLGKASQAGLPFYSLETC